jgi:flagellar biosynthetic protein FliP
LRRPGTALALGAALVALGATAPALAAEPVEALADQLSGGLTPAMVQLIALITVIAVVPTLLVMATSFTKFVVVLSVLRNALGLQQSPPNMVIVGLAMFLTLFVMQPTLERAWQEGIDPYLSGNSTAEAAFTDTLEPFRAFMTANVRGKDLALFEELAARRAGSPETVDDAPQAGPEETAAASPSERPPLTTLVPAFMTSELRKAFTIAFLVFIPFLVIEMIVSSVLMAMGMMMLPPVVVSLPFKLIFFVLVDGWWLLAGSLARSYN